MQTDSVEAQREAPLGEAAAEPSATAEPPSPSRGQGRRGATSMEYLVMLSFILLVVIVGVQTFGSSLAALFRSNANATSQTPPP
jgi:Flp pilus assembly pilin Flp